MTAFFGFVVIYNKDIETKENKIWTKDKTEQQHLYQTRGAVILACEQSNLRVSRVTSREFPYWRASSQASFFWDPDTKKWVGKNKA